MNQKLIRILRNLAIDARGAEIAEAAAVLIHFTIPECQRRV